MNITALSGDMIELAAQMDCVVNPANRELTHGGTLSGLIFDAAGSEALEFDLSGVLSTAAGSAVLTEGYSLCRFIIHTLAPKYRADEDWTNPLRHCYRSCLEIARVQPSIRSIAIPALGTGAHSLPFKEADKIAAESCLSYAKTFPCDLEVTLCFAPGAEERAQAMNDMLTNEEQETEE